MLFSDHVAAAGAPGGTGGKGDGLGGLKSHAGKHAAHLRGAKGTVAPFPGNQAGAPMWARHGHDQVTTGL